MAYIGRQLVRGQNRVLDDISGSFNGSTTAFNLTVSSSSSPPASVNQLWIILGGVLQKPGTDFTVADAVLTFTTAPASTLSFWGMIQGDTSDINSPADASVTPSKIANSGDFAFPADVRFNDADGSHYVGLQAPSTVSSNLVWSLPAADGSANQLLKTDGSGNLGWASDTQSNLLDEDNMSSNSATQPASQQSIKAYADTKAVLTGSTNNTVCTVTGANAIAGEANLTFDGTKLLLGGVTLSSSNERPLQVNSVDGPKIAIGRNDTSITDGNTIGGLEFYGNDADGTFVNTAAIIVNADGTHGNNDKPTRMQFYTTTDDASSATEKLRITSAGFIGAGTTSPNHMLQLHRSDSNNSYTQYTNSTTGSASGDGVWLGMGGDEVCYLWQNENNYMVLGTNNSERLRITATGAIQSKDSVSGGGNASSGFLIGATDTACYLAVQGKSAANGGAAGNAVFQGYFGADNTFRVNSNGLIKTSAGIDFSGAQTNTAGMASETLGSYERGTWTPADGSSDSLTFSLGSASYVKVGDLVFINFYISFPTNSGSQTNNISGLPFAAKGSTNYSYLTGRVAGLTNGVAVQVNTGQTYMHVYVGDSAYTNSQLSGKYILVSGCYTTL